MSPAWTHGAETALVVVDVQNDFADPQGSLYVPGGEGVAEAAAELMDAAARNGSLVVCTQDWHPQATPHFREYGGPWPRHCVAGSWGAALHPRLPRPAALVRKGEDGGDGYSGFAVRDQVSGDVSPTGLEGILRGAGIKRVVLAGLALDVCVRATALDSRELGLETVLRRAATAAVELTPGDGDRTLAELEGAGVLLA